MKYDQIERDFITRTLNLLDSYKGEFEVTLLINCCLGLIVLPKEKHYRSIPDTKIPATGTLWGLSRQKITVDCDSCGYKLKDVIRRIRNGICHFRVETSPNGSDKIETLKISDGGRFQAVLSCSEARELAESFAKHVLENINQESTR